MGKRIGSSLGKRGEIRKWLCVGEEEDDMNELEERGMRVEEGVCVDGSNMKGRGRGVNII